jgi:hypothetical protein
MSEGTIPSLEGWIAALTRPAALAELAALLVSGLLAWTFSLGMSRAIGPPHQTSILFGRRILDGALFPLLWLPFAYLAQTVLARWVPMAVFNRLRGNPLRSGGG